MKIINLIPVLFIIHIGFIQAQVNLTGSWALYNAGGGSPVGTVQMSINHTGDVIKASGPNWSGVGKYNFTTNKGTYNWEFTDGKVGTTTFTYIPDYDIIYTGSVSGSGVDWEFIGRRNTKPLNNFTGSYKNTGTTLEILILKQTGNYLEFFRKTGTYYYYGTGNIFGDMAIVNYTRLNVGYFATLTPVGTGQFYFFLSNDLQSIMARFYPLDLPASSTFPFYFSKLPDAPLFSPPPGWIGTDGKQSCIQSGSGLRLSCYSGDDFAESGYCMDPRTIDLIDNWLSKARPFYGWDKAYYDCWGRWAGTSRNGETRGNCHRPETDGKTRCEYLLVQLKGVLPNVDASILPAMSLESYLIRQLLEE